MLTVIGEIRLLKRSAQGTEDRSFGVGRGVVVDGGQIGLHHLRHRNAMLFGVALGTGDDAVVYAQGQLGHVRIIATILYVSGRLNMCRWLVGFVALATLLRAQPKPQDTEVWGPVPKVVTPGADNVTPPSDAIVLFDGRNLEEWVSAKDKSPAKWIVAGGVMTVDKAQGNIETRRTFRDYQLHLEFRIPANITGSGQDRGNSGVFLASTGPGDAGYELQILDSFNNKTYVNGQAGSIYKQGIPLVNPNRKPGEWQTYDVVWTAPRFNADGSVKSPAYVTVLFNGVLVQNHFELKGETLFIGQPFYKKYERAPIKLRELE